MTPEKRMGKFDFEHAPVKLGLLWAAATVLLIMLIEYYRGIEQTSLTIAIRILLFVPGGVAWGYMMRFFERRQNRS